MIDAEKIVNGEFNPENRQNLCFPTTPLSKFIILNLLSFGAYSIIWTYKLWKTIKVDFGYIHINPILRTLFMGITNFSLFYILDKHIRRCKYKDFPAIFYAFLSLICIVFDNAPNSKTFLFVFAILIISIIQHKLNEINKTHFPTAPINSWNYANTIWATIFSMLWFLLIYGMLK